MTTLGKLLMVLAAATVGSSVSTEPSHSAIFQKEGEVSITQAKWMFSFVIDLEAYEFFMSNLREEIVNTDYTLMNLSLIAIGQQKYEELVVAYSKEIKAIKLNYNQIMKELRDIKSLGEDLDSRTKRSLIPIIGKGLSYLFGTATKGDIKNM